MRQIPNDTGQILPIRFAPDPPTVPRAPLPLRRPEMARRGWLTAALPGLFRLLFVTPIGRRAREERLGGLSDHALRDIGLMRSDVGASASRMVALDVAMGAYPSAGPLVSDRRGQPLILVRLNRAA